MTTFKNPVIEGFSPDPSVCRAGEDFYLVTSTFAYFPAVPIYHSKDLVNWKQIGNVLDRKEQINLLGASHSQGIFAPCLRYHQGTFYMITTNVTHGGNFMVTATNPAGPWSNPYFIKNAPGIDPSLFFDEDGRCYYVGTRPNPSGPKYDGDWEVWLQEIDLNTKQLIGVSTGLWKGAMRDVVWPEGPHLYVKDGYYYLMIAEGGTGSNHCVTIARSKQIEGPYVGNKNNPILTHRHLGKSYPIHNVGHGDLVETSQGKWYMTCLASRLIEGYSNLGRETFLAEVVWEDGWPVVNPGHGKLLEEQTHALALYPHESKTHYSFDRLHSEFLFLRNPHWANYDINSRPGWLRLLPTAITLADLASPTYISLRQRSINYRLSACFENSLKEGEAGLAILQSDRYSIRLVASKQAEGYLVQLITRIAGEEKIVGQTVIEADKYILELRGTGQKIKAICHVGNEEKIIAEEVDSHYLSTEVAGGFVGCTMGLYAYAPSGGGYVDVNWLSLESLPTKSR